MTCETCDGFGYLLTAPATYQEGGEMRSCPVCTASSAIMASGVRNLPDFWMVDELRRRGWLVREAIGADRFANDEAAKALYDTWSDQPGWVPWVERGNSTMQDKARTAALNAPTGAVEKGEAK